MTRSCTRVLFESCAIIYGYPFGICLDVGIHHAYPLGRYVIVSEENHASSITSLRNVVVLLRLNDVFICVSFDKVLISSYIILLHSY